MIKKFAIPDSMNTNSHDVQVMLTLNEIIEAVNRIEDGTRCPSRCDPWNVRCDLNVAHEGLHRHGSTEDGAVYWVAKI